MTHLRIELNTTPEIVTSDVIHKLYETAKAIIDAEEANDVQESLVSLKGNLLVSKAYGDEVLWLIDKFGPELSINVTLGSYIRFADDAIADRMIALYSGDGIGVTNADLSGVTTLNYAFVGNKKTQIQTFNELGSIHSITSLGTFCFGGCSNLRSIDLSNILYLGGEALLGCVSLSGIINLPNLILVGDSVRGSTFSGCTGITLINFGQSFSTMNEALTFTGCTGLTTITGFDNITTIPDNTFRNCTSLASIDLSNVTNIGQSSFLNCTSLTSVDLSSCTTIGNKAFSGCTSLTNIGTDLSNTTYISWDNTFANCPITNDIIIQNHDFRNNNSILAFIGTRIRSLVVRGGTWPNSKDFGGRTYDFRSILGNNPNLLYVDLSESLFTSHSNSGHTFVGNTSLKWVKYPSTLVTFGKSEFGGCTSLEAIVLPAEQVVGSIIAESSYGSYAELHTLWSSAATVPSRLRVYVPDALVNDYKQHYAWSEYTDLIKPMSELPDLQAMISST